jgi:hypothetical protein
MTDINLTDLAADRAESQPLRSYLSSHREPVRGPVS